MTSVHTVIVHKATEQQMLQPKGRKRSSQLLPAQTTTNLVAGPLVVPVVVLIFAEITPTDYGNKCKYDGVGVLPEDLPAESLGMFDESLFPVEADVICHCLNSGILYSFHFDRLKLSLHHFLPLIQLFLQLLSVY